MSTTITNANYQSIAAPVTAIGSTPTHTVVGASSEIAALGDYYDTTYLRVTAPGTFRYRVAPIFVPNGARVVSVNPVVGANPEGTAPVTLKVGMGDYATGSYKDNGGSITYTLDYANKYLPAKTLSTAGVPYTAADLAKGVVLTVGATTVPSAYRYTVANVSYTLDIAPYATLTGPFTATSSRPSVAWDYVDDRQPQVAYRLTLTNNATGDVYDSGKVSSAATTHTVTRSLPNGTYTAVLFVYQAWAYGDFPSLRPETKTLTINAPATTAPNLTATLANDHARITVVPTVNLLNQEQSTADVDSAARTLTNATLSRSTPAKSGTYAYALTSVDAGTSSVLWRPLVSVTPGVAYTAAANVRLVNTVTRTANVALVFYDTTGAVIGAPVVGADVPALSTDWLRPTSQATAPAGAVSAALMVTYSTPAAAGDTLLIDELGLWLRPQDGSVPAWTAGVAFDSSPNLLPYNVATMDDLTQWSPVGSTAVSSVTLSPSFHGNNAMTLKATSASPTIGAQIITDGDAGSANPAPNYYPVNGAVPVSWGAHFQTDSTVRTVRVYLTMLNSLGNTTQATATGTEVAAGWTRVSSSLTTPPDTVAVSVSVEVAAASGNLATTETHRVDGVYLNLANTDVGFAEGYKGNPAAPTFTIETSDDNATWTALASRTMGQTDTAWSLDDYTVRNRKLRLYRAKYTQTVGTAVAESVASTTAFVRPSFEGVWLYSVADPAGTVHQFRYDGGGRTRTVGAVPALTQLENAAHPFAEFGAARTSTVAVSLTLGSDSDISALYRFAGLSGPVVFRDQRGRLLQGVMGDVSFSDEVWGQTASFTLTETSS